MEDPRKIQAIPYILLITPILIYLGMLHYQLFKKENPLMCILVDIYSYVESVADILPIS